MDNIKNLSDEDAFVVNLLNDSISPIENVRNSAYKQILEFETNPAFLSKLVDISYSRNDDISRLAFVCLRNVMSRACASNVRHHAAANHETRANIHEVILSEVKHKLLCVFDLACGANSHVIPKEYALLVRKICRWEYPLNWMQLHERLEGALQQSVIDASHRGRVLNVVFLLYHIIKEKASMRLLRDRNTILKLAENFYPYVSKLWVHQWIDRWGGAGNLELDASELGISLYLDSLILCLYTHGLKSVYQDEGLLGLLDQLLRKTKLHFDLARATSRYDELIRKNLKRLLFGLGQLLEHEPISFAFLDIKIFLDPVFDFISTCRDKVIVNGCFLLLTSIFKSPVMNNERYCPDRLEIKENGDLGNYSTSINSDVPKGRNIPENFKFYKTFEEFRMAYKAIDSKKCDFATTLRGTNHSFGSLTEYISRQATLMFYECLSRWGGLLQLIELLRCNYLRLTLEEVMEWSEEEDIPTECPRILLVPELIDAIKVNSASMFLHIFNFIITTDPKADFLNFDSFLYLYTITFQGLAAAHSYKHYIAILGAMERALGVLSGHASKLFIFRCSRILNAWVKRVALFEEQSKSEILKFLVNCICYEGNSDQAINLRVQHLVPLHNFYAETSQENIWNVLFKELTIKHLVNNLLSIAKVEIPTIQRKCIKLICEICMEFGDENSDIGESFQSLLSVCDTGSCGLQMTESLLQVSLSFLNSLDWRKCFNDDMYINSHLVRFLYSLLFRNLVFEVSIRGKKLVSMSKYSELEDDLLVLWLCFLRILPRRLDRFDQTLLGDILSIFKPLLDYMCELRQFEESGNMRALCMSPVALDLVTEYAALIIHVMRPRQIPTAITGCTTMNGFPYIINVNNEMICRNDGVPQIEFNISKAQYLAIRCIRSDLGILTITSGLQLFNILLFGFGDLCIKNDEFMSQLFDIFTLFCSKLNEASSSENQTRSQRCNLLCLTQESTLKDDTTWKHTKIYPENLDILGKVLPIVCRWALDSPTTFSESIYRIMNSSNTFFESIILSLVNTAIQLRGNVYLQLGAIICTCVFVVASARAFAAKPKLFICIKSFNKVAGGGMQADLDMDRLDSVSEKDGFHETHSSIFLPQYLLRITDSVATLFSESRGAILLSASNIHIKRDPGNVPLPLSNRILLSTNISSTHRTIDYSVVDASLSNILAEALQSTIRSLADLANFLDNCVSPKVNIFKAEIDIINQRIQRIIENCHTGNI